MPRCTTAGISLKSNGVVTYRNIFVINSSINRVGAILVAVLQSQVRASKAQQISQAGGFWLPDWGL